jgi:pumilio family protein 6
MKSLKGYTRSSLLHSDAYIAILRLLDVTDDTVGLQKSILAELQVLPKEVKKTVGPPESDDEDESNNEEISPILDIALSDTGSKMFLLLLANDDESRNKYFDPAELDILHANPCVTENGEDVPTSKKSPSTRRSELLQYMKKQMVEVCELHSGVLLKSRSGSKVLREVSNLFASKKLAQAIVDACTVTSDESVSMFEHPLGHLSLKSILLNESNATSDENFVFNAINESFGGKLVATIGSTNRGAFILAAMAEVDITKMKEEITEKEINVVIKKSKKAKQPFAGYEALLKALQK